MSGRDIILVQFAVHQNDDFAVCIIDHELPHLGADFLVIVTEHTGSWSMLPPHFVAQIISDQLIASPKTS
jgi:hypothetical protein